VGKALAILEVLATTNRGTLGVSALAARVMLPKSTTHRLLKALESQGLVDRSRINYRVGAHFFELCHAARWSIFGELRDLAAPVLEELFDRLRLTVHLATLEGSDVLYLEKISGSGGTRIPSRVGSRMRANCTALGKAMLAFNSSGTIAELSARPLDRVTQYSIIDHRMLLEQLAAVRQTGVAYEVEEARLGIACVAAPIRAEDGTAVGAVSVAGPTLRSDPKASAPVVRAAARQIEQLAADAGFVFPNLT
jgi:DNA-binding IclR family transcriptional regulator